MKYNLFLILLACCFLCSLANPALSASATEIDAKVDAALNQLYNKVNAGEELVSKAEGVLVFPNVLKAGFWVGGEYGQGALRVNGQTLDYYNVAGASLGLQFGVQARNIVILFMTQEALSSFRMSHGWEAGVDGSVAIAELGAGGTVNTNTIQDPIIGFVFGNKGLMLDVSLKGIKISKINK